MRVAVGVQVLHLVLIDVGLLDFVLRAEAVLELVAGAQVAQLGLHHRAEVSRRVMTELHDLAEVAVEDDDDAFADIVGLHELVNPFAGKLRAPGCRHEP